MRRSLEDRSILITGASRGIGRRTAERLARLGANVTVTARSADELASLVGDIRALGGEAEAVDADLTDPLQRQLVVATAVERFGGLDGLVNCAGVASFGEFATSTPDILRRVMELNFFVPSEMIRLCQPHLTESATRGRQPAVVNVASICGRAGIPSLPEHCASKHALVGLTEALRAEFARYDIDVLLVLPGVVRSDDLNRHLIRNEGQIYLNFEGAQPPEEVADSVVRSLVRNRREAAVGFVSWWLWVGRRLWPRGVRWIMRRKVEKFQERLAATQRGA
jgi:NAD(P)-dependent dehydrogenase (short-subunit alcohol dehydrogenase family)